LKILAIHLNPLNHFPIEYNSASSSKKEQKHKKEGTKDMQLIMTVTPITLENAKRKALTATTSRRP